MDSECDLIKPLLLGKLRVVSKILASFLCL